MKPQTKSAINELVQQGYGIKQIMDKLRLDESAELVVTNMHHKHHMKQLNSKVTSLQKELGRRKCFELEFNKAKQENLDLKAKIKSMQSAVDNVNQLSAERSKLIRKLKRAGIKL